MKKYINPGYSNITRTSTRVTTESGETVRASGTIRGITSEQWLEHLEIKYRNCLVKAQQFDKPYEREEAKFYLYRAIMIRMKILKEKYCEIK